MIFKKTPRQPKQYLLPPVWELSFFLNISMELYRWILIKLVDFQDLKTYERLTHTLAGGLCEDLLVLICDIQSFL